MTKFGISEEDWDVAKEELRSSILKHAYQRKMTYYGEIAAEVEVIYVPPHSVLLNHLLGEIFDDDVAKGHPLITSIVTHKSGDREPGEGFYSKARSSGFKFDKPHIFWSDQVMQVFKKYGNQNRN
jgi:hypothetical protein